MNINKNININQKVPKKEAAVFFKYEGKDLLIERCPNKKLDFSTTAKEQSVVCTLPRLTDHSYQDYSTYVKNGGKLEKHKKSERNFPAHLHKILSNEQYSHVISWMPHGRAWKVLNKRLFVDEVIPKYFRQSKYASFTRQLSGWGFKKLYQTGEDFGCYYHECFLRGHPRLTILMRRVSRGQGKASPNTTAEPDFYAIAQQYPLLESDDKLVISPKFECKKEEAKTKLLPSAQGIMNFDPFLPVSKHNHDSLELATNSRSQTSVNQFHVMNHRQCLGRAPQQDEAVHLSYTQPESYYHGGIMFRHNYLDNGDFYRQSTTNVTAQGRILPQPQTKTASSMCMDDTRCIDGTTCHVRNDIQQYSAGSPSREAPTGYFNIQNLNDDPLMFRQNSIGNRNTNLSNYYSNNNDQGQAQGFQDQLPQTQSISSADAEDFLQQMPTSIPDQGLEFDVSEIEASILNSFLG